MMSSEATHSQISQYLSKVQDGCVAMVPEFTLLVGFEKKTAVMVLVSDERVSLPLTEVLDMGDCVPTRVVS